MSGIDKAAMAKSLVKIIRTYSPFEVDSDYNEVDALRDIEKHPEGVIDYLITLIEDAEM